MAPVVLLRNVTKAFGSLLAVDRVSLTLEPGRVFALLGPNGAGKTTTLRLLMGIYFPDSGEVQIFGGEPRAARSRIGYLPESRGLYRQARVQELLEYLARLRGLSTRAARQSARAWLARFDLLAWAKAKVHELSHGMQQKVQLAVTLIHDPDLVILDEPFQGLDPVNAQLVDDIIGELRSQGRTLLLSSHQLHRVERLADEVALIHQGRIVEQGRLADLRRRYALGQVVVRFDGDGTLPADLPGVKAATRDGDGWLLTLDEQTSPSVVLRTLVQRGVSVREFGQREPSLESIFLRAVAAWQRSTGAADQEE